MTSELKRAESVRAMQPEENDAFQAFFDMVDAPAALCDAELRVLTANAAFAVLCGQKQLSGRALSDLLGASVELPAEGHTHDVEVVCRTAQTVTLTISRRGSTVAVVAKRLSPTLDSLAAAGRALIEQARVETQLLELGRAVVGAGSEEELVATVARGVKGLFVGRTFSVRIVDPRTCALTSLYAEGRLRDGPRDVIHLRRSMIDKTHLDVGGLPVDRVVLVPNELPLLFHGSVKGIAAPLVANGQLFGAINIEYPAGLTADSVADERVLIQLANQVAVAVRNVKLIDELTFVRKYLEDLLENGNALILVVNRERRVVVFNRALAELTGRSRADVLGNDVTTLVPASERLRVAQAFGAPMTNGAAGSFETVLLGRNDRPMKVTFSTSPVASQSGESEGVIAIGQDLTKMRDLEGRVIQAEKLASLGQLAASVVHEINNPLTAVVTYADALLGRSLTNPNADPHDVEKYRKILSNSERVLRFTRDLVSYARPAQETPEEVDLTPLMERAIGFCEHVLAKYGVTLVRDFGSVPKFLAVRQNLVQVLVNLITNACHATPSGGSIRVSTRLDDERVLIMVEDTGSGIPEEVRARIFEPFFTTKPDGKGTGLGLSIVHGIVEKHGGTISVESQVGQGTKFSIRLPLGA